MRRVHLEATKRMGANRLGQNGMRGRVHWEGLDGTVRTLIPSHIDLAGNTSYHFGASRTVFPRVSPYHGPGPFAPFGSRI